jgi:hypothetical protein
LSKCHAHSGAAEAKVIRFDHAVVAVRDLDKASERMTAAGFEVRAGGRHIGFGTENAIIRFGLDYIELISVRDEEEARQASLRSRTLADFIAQHGNGLVGYAFADDDLHTIAAKLRAAGEEPGDPTPMKRERPDGTVLHWDLLIPGGVAWRRPWPFFIAWGVPDAERLSIERPAAHPNGAVRVSGISIAVPQIERARVLHASVLGESTTDSTGAVSFSVGGVKVEIVGPEHSRARLDRGPGPFELRLSGSGPPRAEELLGAAFRFD